MICIDVVSMWIVTSIVCSCMFEGLTCMEYNVVSIVETLNKFLKQEEHEYEKELVTC